MVKLSQFERPNQMRIFYKQMNEYRVLYDISQMWREVKCGEYWEKYWFSRLLSTWTCHHSVKVDYNAL